MFPVQTKSSRSVSDMLWVYHLFPLFSRSGAPQDSGPQ